jgi:predicted RecB family nuclease
VRERPRLTATHFYLYATCEHRVRLELFGDRGLLVADTEAQRTLKAHGLAHEAAIAAKRGYPRPAHGRDDLDRAFQETLALMREGREGIYQGVLLADGLVGMPDLLIKRPGASVLGDHHYTAGDVKISQRARSDQALQVAFYAHLLAEVQGVRPDHLFLLLGDGRETWFPTEEVGGAFDQAFQDLSALRDGTRGTEPFLMWACEACPWRGVCLPDLEARDDLSRLPGMTPSRRRALRRAGIETVAALAAGRADAIAKRSGLERCTLTPLIRQAVAMATDRAVPLSAPPRPEGPPELLVTALENPRHPGHTLLLTVSFTDPAEGPKTAVLLAATPTDEKALYEKMLTAFGRKPSLPVYHYGGAATTQIARLEARHGAGGAGLRALDRMIDLAPLVRRTAALPLTRYTLGEVARATGQRGPAPEEEAFLDAWKLLDGEAEARVRLVAAAEAERDALMHLLAWLRRGGR